MIYFDSTYLGRLYLQEPGSAEVRSLAAARGTVTCSELGQVEVASILHRKLREGTIRSDQHTTLVAQLEVERAQQQKLATAPDYAEGVAAFFAKRAATFVARS